MSTSVLARRACVLALFATWLGAGCAGASTSVVETLAVEKAPPVRRFMVVSQVAWVDKAWSAPFHQAMVEELRKLDLATAVQSRDPLAVQTDKARYASQIVEFKPDVVLVIEPGDGSVDQEGRNLTRRFELGLFRNYTTRDGRALIWRARTTLTPQRAYIKPADMSALARDVVARLAADHFLPRSPQSNALPPLQPLLDPSSPSDAPRGSIGLPPLKPLFDPASWPARSKKVKKPPLRPLRPLFGPASEPANGG